MKKQKQNGKPHKKRVYKSAEARARQLAGLAGVRIEDHVHGCEHIQKVNGQGLWASVSEEQRKKILELYTSGKTIVQIAEITGLSKTVVGDVKLRALDEDTQFANDMFKINFRRKLQRTAENALDRVEELLPEMEGRDAVLAFSKAAETLMEMEAQQAAQVSSVHMHVHTNDAELRDQFLFAMKPAVTEIQAAKVPQMDESRPQSDLGAAKEGEN